MIFEYEGTDIAPLVSVARCAYDAREEGRVPQLVAEFTDARGLWDAWGPKPGDRITVGETGAASTGALYVTDCTPVAGGYALRADALPIPDAIGVREWRDTTLYAVAGQLAAALGLTPAFHGCADMALTYVRQDGEGALPVLARLCMYAGATFDVYDGALHVCGREWTAAQQAVAVLDIAADSDYAYTTRQGYTCCNVNQTEIAGIRRGMAAVGGTSGRELALVLDGRVGFPGTAELSRAGVGILACANARLRGGHVESGALSPLSPGSVCEIRCKQAPSLDGNGVVTRVRNDFAGKKSKVWWR